MLIAVIRCKVSNRITKAVCSLTAKGKPEKYVDIISKAATAFLAFHMKRKNKSWYKPKGYLHISPKLKENQKGFVSSYIESKLEHHNFYPLIHETLSVRRFKQYLDSKGQIYRSHYDVHKHKSSKKNREIFYANHLDAHIYSYFSNKVLGTKYEQLLSGDPKLSEAIIAYRRIPINPKESLDKCKCNIHFANELFDEVKRRKECIVVCYDIENFFPSLDHEYLELCWLNLLKIPALNKMHKKVLKSLTHYSYVELSDVITQCSNEQLEIKHKKDFIKSDYSSYFISAKEFREKIAKKNLIRRHKANPKEYLKGIPQGTPISAFLANLYLYGFDKFIVDELVTKEGCFYRRYSDDIAIIFENFEQYESWNEEIIKKISSRPFNLKINDAKTVISHFFVEKEKIKCQTKVELRTDFSRKYPLKYLGFEFNGGSILLKQASLAKFYRDMKHLVRIKTRKAISAGNYNHRNPERKPKDTKIHLSKAYTRFTHLGKNKAKSNYLRYVDRSANVIYPSFQGDKDPIKKQIRRAWSIFNTTVRKHKQKKAKALTRQGSTLSM